MLRSQRVFGTAGHPARRPDFRPSCGKTLAKARSSSCGLVPNDGWGSRGCGYSLDLRADSVLLNQRSRCAQVPASSLIVFGVHPWSGPTFRGWSGSGLLASTLRPASRLSEYDIRRLVYETPAVRLETMRRTRRLALIKITNTPQVVTELHHHHDHERRFRHPCRQPLSRPERGEPPTRRSRQPKPKAG